MPAFLLPDLGEGLTDAEIVTWHVQAGDVVAVGEPLVTVDTADRFAEPGVVTPPAGLDRAGESGNVLIGYGTSSGRRRRHRAMRSPATIPAPGSPAAGTA